MSEIDDTDKSTNESIEHVESTVDKNEYKHTICEEIKKENDKQLKTDSVQQIDIQSRQHSVWPKSRKRRKRRDENAPRMPLTGYIRFLNDRREILKHENPSLGFTEVTKQLGSEWSSLLPGVKQKYLDEAEKDKLRYYDEIDTYHASDKYKEFLKKQEVVPDEIQSDEEVNFVIPIFTQQFLEHNTMREAELRRLKRNIAMTADSNAGLKKHIECMSSAVDCLNTESAEQHANNLALQNHMVTLRKNLTKSFADIDLPDFEGHINLDNVDEYMNAMNKLVQKYLHNGEVEDAADHKVFKTVSAILDSMKMEF